MLTPQGKVKVLDFGIAKRLFHSGANDTEASTLTTTGMIVGTLSYIADRGSPGQTGRQAERHLVAWNDTARIGNRELPLTQVEQRSR